MYIVILCLIDYAQDVGTWVSLGVWVLEYC